ncbi:MAG: 4Fe-4S dicluster domain-containing protein [Candidatus Bathyarchaeota archaeon]|nr:4Fe-4S dicluster domain-containing protein [Candidatus Bathyarchaeota archaeon]
MPLKELKTETENMLTIERILHAKRYSLALNKTLCVGCEICQIVCPREAIEIKKIPKKNGEKAQRPIIDVSEQKCSYCGMCEPICPFNAIEVRVDQQHMVPVLEKESFPELIREIEVDPTLCDIDCIDCEKACPLNLITVKVLTSDEKEIKPEEAKSLPNKENLKVKVDIKKNLSPCCRLCEMKCPKGAIHVRKIMHGLLKINLEKCPPGCQDCLDVCPIPGAFYLDENDKKVHPNETFCVFCGTCKIVCPVEDALIFERRSIHHTPVSSGAWNKALEKLTSTKEYSKEAKTKALTKAQKMVEKMLLPKEAS